MTAAARSLDLGPLDGPVLIFGGPYSNLAATLAMRRQAEDLAIPPKRIVCTGDVVAYCAEPGETVELVRDWGITVVQGNCEEALGQEAPDCGCGFAEGTACSLLAVGWYRHATERIAAAQRAWMRSLPNSVRFELNGHSVRVVHGGVEQINRFIFPSTPEEEKRGELDRAGTDLLVGGHSGIPCAQAIGGRAWLNAGAIGLPANDGTPDGWYLLLLPEGERLRCSLRRLNYDPAPSAAGMRAAELCGGYQETLESGLWPSLDALPAAERARRGVPIVIDDLIV